MVLFSTYQSTDNPLLSTLYEPLSKHLISVLACEKRETKVPSERASCPRVDTRGTGEMRTDASWASMENDHRC